MQTTLTPHEIVGAKLVEWYSCIVARDIEQANELKEVTDRLITNMVRNDKVLIHHKLVSLRHEFMIRGNLDEKLSNEDVDKIFAEADATDEHLKYLYYYMTAQFECYSRRYHSATRLYHIAERYIPCINSPYEKGEFYSRLGFCYYRMDDYTRAVEYIKRALDIFDADKKYEERFLNCNMILAYVATELNQYAKAESYYNLIYERSKLFPETHAIILRGIGLNRIRQNKLEEAKYFLSLCLEQGNHLNAIIMAQATYNLANTLHRLGERTEAKQLLDQAEEKSLELGLGEHIAKCMITRGLYEKEDLDMVNEGLELLKEQQLTFEYNEMAEEISIYFEKNKEFQISLDFLRKAYGLPKNLKLLED
ncbi:tetratricopeptide repeat protein [Alkalihalobacillus sp. NPDC078783]